MIKLSRKFKDACQNVRMFDFAFGKPKHVYMCSGCGKTIKNPDEISFMGFEGVCFACEHVSGNVEDMLAEHEDTHFNNMEVAND